MKAIFQKVTASLDASFIVQEIKSGFFNRPWHFHREYELAYILEGTGKRFIGDKIDDFGPGNLVLMGSNLPHWYRCDECYYKNDPTLTAKSIIIQFNIDFLGETFLQSPEMYEIQRVLHKAQRGLEIEGQLRYKVGKMISELTQLKGLERLLHLLAILNTISKSEEYNLLSIKGPSLVSKTNDPKRINTIYEYVMNHFTEPITIEEASGLINMCPATFCRYFKKRTCNTFTFFLNEIRIGHSCKLLIEGELSITEICYKSGFNNISYFNRQFKSHKKLTPQAFRQEYYRQVNFGS
ncbi:MAG: AraC family transcriptional regulator [Sphingobacteriaceae bacterium]